MTKLPPDGERVIRQLDEFDEASDTDPQMKWLQREPYLTRGLWLWSTLRDMRGAVALLARVVEAIEPRLPHQRVSLGQLRRLGPLERLAPPKRKPRWHRLDLIIDDVHRVRGIWRRDGRKKQRRDDQVTAELIAAERHLRLVHGKCTINKLGDLDEEEAELRDLEGKLHNRMRGMGGTTGGERHRREKLLRAK